MCRTTAERIKQHFVVVILCLHTIDCAMKDQNCGYTKGDPLEFSSRDWYHGELMEEEAEFVLTASSYDCFLFRHFKGVLTLSLTQQGEIYHLKIKYGPDGYALKDEEELQPTFAELQELVDHYRTTPISEVIDPLGQICIKITSPIAGVCVRGLYLIAR